VIDLAEFTIHLAQSGSVSGRKPLQERLSPFTGALIYRIAIDTLFRTTLWPARAPSRAPKLKQASTSSLQSVYSAYSNSRTLMPVILRARKA